MEEGQCGTYLRLTRELSGPRVSVTKTYRDETKTKMEVYVVILGASLIWMIHHLECVQCLMNQLQKTSWKLLMECSVIKADKKHVSKESIIEGMPVICTTKNNIWPSVHSIEIEPIKQRMSLHFYFQATLRVKEVLQSSKNLTQIFLWFLILHHSHSLKCVLEKNVCVCVCVCVCLTIADRRA